MSTHKYSAFVKFKGKRDGKMEFSDSYPHLEKMILLGHVTQVKIYKCANEKKGKDRLMVTYTKK